MYGETSFEATNQVHETDVFNALSLSQELNPDLEGAIPATKEDLEIFINTTGDQTLKLLNQMKVRLFLCTENNRIPLKHPIPNKRRHPLDLITNYIFTDFVTFFDSKIVFFSTFIKKDNILNTSLPKKVVQIDFLSNSSDSYELSEEPTLVNSPGHNDMSGRVFLRKLLRIAESISPETILQISAHDEQRKRLYKRALRNLPNVRFL